MKSIAVGALLLAEAVIGFAPQPVSYQVEPIQAQVSQPVLIRDQAALDAEFCEALARWVRAVAANRDVGVSLIRTLDMIFTSPLPESRQYELAHWAWSIYGTDLSQQTLYQIIIRSCSRLAP